MTHTQDVLQLVLPRHVAVARLGLIQHLAVDGANRLAVLRRPLGTPEVQPTELEAVLFRKGRDLERRARHLAPLHGLRLFKEQHRVAVVRRALLRVRRDVGERLRERLRQARLRRGERNVLHEPVHKRLVGFTLLTRPVRIDKHQCIAALLGVEHGCSDTRCVARRGHGQKDAGQDVASAAAVVPDARARAESHLQVRLERDARHNVRENVHQRRTLHEPVEGAAKAPGLLTQVPVDGPAQVTLSL